MNCTSFRKYVGAFADGELDTDLNLQALEHLNMCPSCARRVAEVELIKASLKRICGDQRAPEALRERVRLALGESLAASAEPAPAPRRFRLTVPLAVAAALALSVTVWQFQPATTSTAPFPQIAAAPIAAEVRAQHSDCAAHGFKHHDPTLARNCQAIREVLGERLGLDVIAPDLEGSGCELVGADQCGVRSRKGAHVLYRCEDTGAYVSVFTLARLPELPEPKSELSGPRAYFVDTSEGMSVVAWQGRDASYILCGEVPSARLIDMANPIQTADAGPIDQPFQRFAARSRQ
jgi:mycothiol system anti-sigma-R factor